MAKLTIVAATTKADMRVLDLGGRLTQFAAMEKRVRNKAAKIATETTRNSFTYLRPTTRSRPGRRSTQGQLPRYATWRARSNESFVDFNVAEMDRVAPHWLINEIGTGSRAQLKFPGQLKAGRGRKSKIQDVQNRVRRVPKQAGRMIPKGIVFADAAGVYVPPTPGSRLHNTALASKVTGLPPRYNSTSGFGMRINREIQPKNFVKKGSRTGFDSYRRELLDGAQRAFGGKPRR